MNYNQDASEHPIAEGTIEQERMRQLFEEYTMPMHQPGIAS